MYQDLIHEFEALFIEQDYEQAIKKLEAAITAGAVNGANYFYLGVMHEKLGNLAEASKYFGIAVGHSPNEPLFWLFYGEALKLNNQAEDGNIAVEYAKSLNNHFESAFSNIKEVFKWAENLHLETNFWQINLEPSALIPENTYQNTLSKKNQKVFL